jgi:hypothetical protein
VVAPDHYVRKDVDLLDRWLARRLCHDQRHAFADKADTEGVTVLSLRGFQTKA